jgi:hypothetical protein
MSFRALVLALLFPLCGACASTTWESTWRNPDAGPVDYTGKRVATVFISSEESTRRAAEDALAAEVSRRGSTGVPSYTLLAAEDLQDEAAMRAKLLAAGCEAALVMRITAEEQRIRSTDPFAGGYYSSFSSYSHHEWAMAYAPTHVTTDTIVHAETLVYDLRGDKLLWAGTSRTFEPDRTEEFVVELAEGAAEEMRKEGLLRGEPG